MKHKRSPITIDQKSTDFSERTITGYASVFGVEDHAKDTVLAGAFSHSLKSKSVDGRGPRVPLLWQHDAFKPLGMPLKMHEDEKGLFTQDRIVKGQFGDYALECAKEGIADGLSIGYLEIEKEKNETGHNLIKLDLIEKSVVTFPCLDVARIDTVKSLSLAGMAGPLREGALSKTQFALLVELTHNLSELIKSLADESEPQNQPDSEPDNNESDPVDESDDPELAESLDEFSAKIANLKSHFGA